MFGFQDRAKRAEVLALRGKALFQNEKWLEALVEFDRAIALDSRQPTILAMRGIARRMAGQLDGALDDFNAALQLAPPNCTRLLQRALVNKSMRKYAQCLADLNAAATLNPEHAPIYSTRAYIYRAMGHHDEAVKDFVRFTQLRPDVARAHFDCATSMMELGDGDGALEMCNRALALDPKMAAARLMLSSLYYKRSDPQHAIEALSALIGESADPPPLSHWIAARAALYRTVGRDDLARGDESEVRRLHKQCVQEIVREGGRIIWGAIVQANSELFESGIFDMLCLVVISFEPELNKTPERLRQLAQKLSSLKGTTHSDPDLDYAATLTTNEYTGSDSRLRIPDSLTGGFCVYVSGLAVRRLFLKQRILATPILPCIATPGDAGRIDLLPHDFEQKARPR